MAPDADLLTLLKMQFAGDLQRSQWLECLRLLSIDEVKRLSALMREQLWQSDSGDASAGFIHYQPGNLAPVPMSLSSAIDLMRKGSIRRSIRAARAE